MEPDHRSDAFAHLSVGAWWYPENDELSPEMLQSKLKLQVTALHNFPPTTELALGWADLHQGFVGSEA